MLTFLIYLQIQNGFLDAQPVIREKTVIAVIHLAPKLSFTNLDETVVMKNFSRLLRDEQVHNRDNVREMGAATLSPNLTPMSYPTMN